ncbi:MAG: DUF255 domain-containing protein [Bacteroidales bacterium]|nr:DUF255 domain-containing protein [Bacteroidales bacterium]
MMKRTILIIGILAAFTLQAFSQGDTKGVKWLTIQKALELNKNEPRKFYIDVYTDWCGWCKKMDQTTYMDPIIAHILNSKFYPVKFNAESKDPVTVAGKTFVNDGNSSRSPHQLAVALLQGKMAYPSVAYLDEKFQLLTVVPGFFTAKNLEPILQFFATDSYKTESWENYQKNFISEIK